jgi:hypothetical protein
MKILDLTNEQTEILDRIYWLSEEEDAAEIERLNRDLVRVKESAKGTLTFLSGLLLESRAILVAREDAKRRAEKRRKTAENATIRLQTTVEYMMSTFEIKKIALDDCDLSLQWSPGSLQYSNDFDPTLLPEDCFQVTSTPVSSAIKARLLDGEELPGVEIVKVETLRIR